MTGEASPGFFDSWSMDGVEELAEEFLYSSWYDADVKNAVTVSLSPGGQVTKQQDSRSLRYGEVIQSQEIATASPIAHLEGGTP